MAYLARYVYRVALSQRAILRHKPDLITLRYRKSKTNVPGTMRLKPHEFIWRFLQHVLPSGFRKIRYFGLHHSSKRTLVKYLRAAMAIQQGQPLPVLIPEEEPFVPTCPDCDEPMRFQRRITPAQHAVLFGKATPSRGPP